MAVGFSSPTDFTGGKMQERFKEIFEGFNDAHGYTYKTGEREHH